jgi:hypothetical protein
MSARSDIVVRCRRGHIMQRFRWMTGQGVWHPTRHQDEVIAVYPGGVVDPPFASPEEIAALPAPDHWRWPLICDECRPRQSRVVRDDRMRMVLTLLAAAGESQLSLSDLDEKLAERRA